MRLIDKEALLEKLFALADANREWKPEYTEFCEDMAAFVEDMPFWSDEDLVPHGRWRNLGCDEYVCSECGFYCEYPSVMECGYSYCPKCGAKMDGGNEK